MPPPASATSLQRPWVARVGYALLFVGTIGLGLASRRHHEAIPAFVARYAGDTLWAAMVYFGASLLWPGRRRAVRATWALAFCFAVEFSQLYHRPWLDDVRRGAIGGLVLGRGFLGSDLVCYAVGVGLAWAVDAAGRAWGGRRT